MKVAKQFNVKDLPFSDPHAMRVYLAGRTPAELALAHAAIHAYIADIRSSQPFPAMIVQWAEELNCKR